MDLSDHKSGELEMQHPRSSLLKRDVITDREYNARNFRRKNAFIDDFNPLCVLHLGSHYDVQMQVDEVIRSFSTVWMVFETLTLLKPTKYL